MTFGEDWGLGAPREEAYGARQLQLEISDSTLSGYARAWAAKRGHHADLQRLRAGRETGKHCHGTHYEDCSAYNLFPNGQFLLHL
jgi:hypothetical protein